MTPEQREKHLKAIEKIESLPRPAKWKEIRKFVLALHPELKIPEAEHRQACQELREGRNEFGASKSMTMRSAMSLYGPVYDAINVLDPDIRDEMAGRNKGQQEILLKNLWRAFPEYRTSRTW